MKDLIKDILKEEVYHIFEEDEFDPLGHVGQESDDPEELDIDLTEDCVLGFSNGNAKLEWPYFSLPAGYTCPFATVCKNFPAKWEGPTKGGRFVKPDSWEKNIKPGPEAKFMCYAARAQGQYPAANVKVFKNLNLLKKHKTADAMSKLILKSLRFHGLDNSDIFRIHEAGDFFSQAYFDAWLEVARSLPGTLFYVYTMSLPFWEARKGQIPRNFKLIASMDEGNQKEILEKGFRYAKIVNSVEEAKALGLPIDVDDSIAWGSDQSFALLLHGPQPKGSEAAAALKRNKEAGMYGKEGLLNQAKTKNQAKKDSLRDKIRRQLRNESKLVEDLKYWGFDGDSIGPLKEIDDEWGSDNTELQGHKNYTGWVFIHRNLHKPPYWSIKRGKSGGKVIGYDTDIWLTDVIFKVQKGGRERVRKEMKKNVHAGVVGKIKSTGGNYDTNGWTLVTYNPYKNDTFVEYKTGEPVYEAKEAILKNTKEVWIKK